MPASVALIPARSGSTRIPHKNIQYLGDHPLLAYIITAAIKSGIFKDVIVSTDSEHYAQIARHYGAEVPFLRPVEIAGTKSPDIEWVDYTLERLKQSRRSYDCFSILRPTSPFRRPETIRRAWSEFVAGQGVDSLRAVQKCSEHPGKMWVVRRNRMTPLLPMGPAEQPWHSSQYPSLPEIYVQNASLEIARTRVVFKEKTIAGTVLMPFFTKGHEGFDVNSDYDWNLAEHLVETDQARLPSISQPTYEMKE